MLLWQFVAFHWEGPRTLLSMSSSSNRPAIQSVQWLDDNDTFYFLGEDVGESQQLYRFDVRSQTVSKITQHRTNLVSYSVTPRGDEVAFVAESPVRHIFTDNTKSNGLVFTSKWIGDVVADREGTWDNISGELFVKSGSKNPKQLTVDGAIDLNGNTLSLAPNGQYLVIDTRVTTVPREWKDYSDPQIHEEAIRGASHGQFSWLRRYVIVNTSTNESRVLLNSPSEWDSTAAWAPDSGAVALSGMHLPLEQTQGDELARRRKETYAVVVQVPSGAFVPVSDKDLRLQAWDTKTNSLVFEIGRVNLKPEPGPKLLFRQRGGRWEEVANEPRTEFRPEIVLAEDMNSPPFIFAVDGSTHERTLLLDLNPQFKDLEFGRVEQIEWKTSDGRSLKGGLYYPVGYVVGKRYPLVIQTHGWNPWKFRTGGLWSTAFAAQPLAGKGIMVLQVDEGIPAADYDTPKEAVDGMTAYETAIDYLSGAGFIDPSRVGIIGFSRSGLYVKYALTHSNHSFAAAATVDTTDGGYVPYLLSINSHPVFAKDYEHINGGAPFGEGMKSWIANSPELNIDKIKTPLRDVSENPVVTLLVEVYWFGASIRLEKPIDMVVMHDGEHVLQKPWERMVSQQGNVDWFCFWLKDEEDPDPKKAEQYGRWRELRKIQQKNNAKNKPPKKKAPAPN